MREYHKINSLWKRDLGQKSKPIILGSYAQPIFELLKDLEWEWTEKVDGTNIRIHWDGTAVKLGGRTDAAQTPMDLIERLQELFPAPKMLEVFGEKGGITLYGEGYGAGIQKGGAYIPDHKDFILFDVTGGDDFPVWFARDNVEGIAQRLGVKSTPVVGRGTIAQAVTKGREGFVSHVSADTKFLAEGLVIRPATELRDRFGHRVITKIKYRDFDNFVVTEEMAATL
jgi:hypothetical protein